MRVYVINKRNEPLMPTSPQKARILLKNGRAKVVQRTPFTIQLLYVTGESKQDITLGVDAGSKTVGLSATTENEELFAAEVLLRNDIVEKISTRRECRKSRRSRKTRYRQDRFRNRIHNKREVWIAPSIKQKINTHIQAIKSVYRILPIKSLIIEVAQFDTQKLRNPNIQNEEYSKGDQYGFWNVREYVLFRDNHECQYCRGKSKDKVLNVHHIESRKTGGNSPNNLITLCHTCHIAYHTGKIVLPLKRSKSLRDASFMNIMRPELLRILKRMYQNVEFTYGYITKNIRIGAKLEKSHINDARCISQNAFAIPSEIQYIFKAVRTKNRQLHRRTINTGGVRKTNQLSKIIFGFRLFDRVKLNDGRVGFIFGRRKSGCFDIRTLDGRKLTAAITYKKICLIQRSQTMLIDSHSSTLLKNK